MLISSTFTVFVICYCQGVDYYYCWSCGVFSFCPADWYCCWCCVFFKEVCKIYSNMKSEIKKKIQLLISIEAKSCFYVATVSVNIKNIVSSMTRKEFFPCTRHLCPLNPVFSFWPFTIRNTLKCWSKFGEGHQSWRRVGSTSPVPIAKKPEKARLPKIIFLYLGAGHSSLWHQIRRG